MLAPEKDLVDRRLIWDELQVFWMDTDPGIDLERVVRVCARSKYLVADIEQIFWNEVRPAVALNLRSIAGAWTGFEIEWLTERILKTHRFGQLLPFRFLRPGANYWWKKLRSGIERERAGLGELPD